MIKFKVFSAIILLTGILMTPVTKTEAQTVDYGYNHALKTTFGIKLGPNFSKLILKINGDKFNTKMLISFEGGIYVNLPVAHHFYIRPSLMFIREGKKMQNCFHQEPDSHA